MKHAYVRLISNLLWKLERIFFKPKLKRALEILYSKKQNVVIFDIGANRGQSLDFFTEIYPLATFHCFEPLPSVFRKLQRNKNATGNILINSAVGMENCSKDLHMSVMDETSTFVLPNNNSNYNRLRMLVLGTSSKNMYKPINVNVVTLDSYCDSIFIEEIFLLKIDTEGYELEVLKGSRQLLAHRKIKNILLERHEDDMRDEKKDELPALLLANGFLLKKSIRHSFGNFYDDLYVLSV